MSLEVSSSAGMFPSSTVGAPGAQGAGVTGIQGIGVSTPIAPDVAAATVGFARLVHMPNGMMFTIGLLSMMFAAGIKLVIILLTGNTTRVLGATPKVHCSKAPEQTCMGMLVS
jgi:hypothetical protein